MVVKVGADGGEGLPWGLEAEAVLDLVTTAGAGEEGEVELLLVWDGGEEKAIKGIEGRGAGHVFVEVGHTVAIGIGGGVCDVRIGAVEDFPGIGHAVAIAVRAAVGIAGGDRDGGAGEELAFEIVAVKGNDVFPVIERDSPFPLVGGVPGEGCFAGGIEALETLEGIGSCAVKADRGGIGDRVAAVESGDAK